jgi:hippurate hydrolase
MGSKPSFLFAHLREAMSGRTCVCTTHDANPFLQCAPILQTPEIGLSRRGVFGILPIAAGVTLAATSEAATQPAPAAQGAPALPGDLIDKINQLVDADTPRLVEMFKDLHQHPEIGFAEIRTAKIVASSLRELGFAVTEGIGRTGVVGVMQNGPGPVVWSRADMDANSVKETTGLAYAARERQKFDDGSEIDVMHACGHDAHVTWLMGFARAMAQLKDRW